MKQRSRARIAVILAVSNIVVGLMGVVVAGFYSAMGYWRAIEVFREIDQHGGINWAVVDRMRGGQFAADHFQGIPDAIVKEPYHRFEVLVCCLCAFMVVNAIFLLRLRKEPKDSGSKDPA